MKKNNLVVKTLSDLKELKVNQLENKNQFLITGSGFKCFQSYDSLIAIYTYNDKKLTLFSDWDYSNTTRKHLYIFINDYCCIKEIYKELYYSRNKRKTILKLIKDGLIQYDPTR